MTTDQNKNMRKTLVIGLGGSGCRIALELKARLEEREGGKAIYGKAIKFLFVDTAKENFTAYQPNHPERPPVTMESDEFVSISDVPLDDLVESRENNPGLRSVLPSTLYTTQIDQGAQQIRRLGRVALFYHYARNVKGRVSTAINELYDMSTVDGTPTPDGRNLRISERLRVYILGSICGGTGGGTFIDMAYLTRHLVRSLGKERSERMLTTIGILLLPEAFPDIVTTGAQRIRANAYASLLDLEHFSQQTDASAPLYDVELPEEGRIRVSGAPFSWCYLVGSGPFTLHGKVDLEPILAETLYLNVASRLGEQLDATLDNIRPYLTLDYKGYRAFYSALGFSQIIYPDLWIRQRFTTHLQHELLKRLLKGEQRYTPINALAELRQAAEQVLKRDDSALLNPVKAPLSQAKRAITRQDDLVDRIEEAFQISQGLYRERLERTLNDRQRDALEAARNKLRTEFETNLNDVKERGLSWTQSWLYDLETQFESEMRRLREQRQTVREPNDQLVRTIEALRGMGTGLFMVGQIQRLTQAREALEDLKTYLTSRYYQAHTITGHLLEIYQVLRADVSALQRDLADTIKFWDTQRKRLEELTRQGNNADRPVYPPSTTVVLNDQEVEAKAIKLVGSVKEDIERLREFTTSIDELRSSLPGSDQRAEIPAKLEAFCAKQYPYQETNLKDSIDDAKVLSMEQKGAHLLRWAEGMVQHMAPREIRVVGAETQPLGETLIKQRLTNQNDVTVVSTGDANVVTYLSTIHGLPAIALTNFEIYRQQYVELARQNRNAIFHLDDVLENAPHDPAATDFINPQELLLKFGRALAHGWVLPIVEPVDMNNNPIKGRDLIFAVNHTLYAQLKIQAEAQLSDLKRKIDDLGGHEGDFSLELIELEKQRQALTELFGDTSGKNIVGIMPSSRVKENGGGYNAETTPYALCLYHPGRGYDLAGTLAEALRAVQSNRNVALTFSQAFDRLSGEISPRDDVKILAKFLDTNGNARRFSATSADGRRSADLEKRINEMLTEYLRLQKLLKHNDANNRHPLAYYADSEDQQGSR